jgi:eukaryotic-like serine/threonine-protein kinase
MAHVPQALANAMQDRYQLERELGSGGMATVYLAQDLRHGRQVAVKVLHPELSAVLGGDRFLSEIKTTAALQHPHILPLFDSGDAGGNLFYVMPLIEGETLRSRLSREKQLPIADAVRLAREVASALDYAHRHGVIHRDIKPENILLHDGRAVVADFGIALAVQSAGGQRMTQTGLSLGTPQYMSPEQAMGEREITARSDIYALGVVTYEMLTGDPPFTGSTTQSIVARILTEEPRPIGPQRKSVPEAVEAAVLTALEKLPADRFGSAAEFAAALGGEATSTRRATGARPVSFRPSNLLTFRLLLGALLLITAFAAWGWLRAHRPPLLQVTRYYVDLPSAPAPGYGSRVAVSPDGSRIVYMGPGPGGGQLWQRSRDKVEAVPIPGTTGAVHPFFSPDGTRLAYVLNNPSALMVLRLEGGLPAELAKNVGLAGGSWGRDGYLYLDGLGRTLLRLPETGGTASDAAIPDSVAGEEEINMPYALPNGRGVIITIHRSLQPESWVVGVLDTRSGKHRQLLPGVAGYYLPSGHLLVVNAQGELAAVGFDQNRLEVTSEPAVLARGINLDFWRVDMGVGENVLAYALTSTAKDSLEFGWTTGDGTYQPVAPGWVDAINAGTPSPDGTRIAFTLWDGARYTIWIRRLDNGSLSRLSIGNVDAFAPTWSRDSRTVYYTVPRDKGVQLVARPADGSAGETRLASSLLFLAGVTTALDDSTLVYSEYNNESFHNLMLLVPGDSVPKPLLSTPEDEDNPSISPNGRWIAFSSDEGGTTEHVYVRPFPNVTETVWQVSPEPGGSPRWSPDGKELFYRSGDNTIVAVEVLSGPTFALGRRRTVLSLGPYQTSHRAWGIGKDGRLLVLKRLSAPPNLKIVVTQNISAELRAGRR